MSYDDQLYGFAYVPGCDNKECEGCGEADETVDERTYFSGWPSPVWVKRFLCKTCFDELTEEQEA